MPDFGLSAFIAIFPFPLEQACGANVVVILPIFRMVNLRLPETGVSKVSQTVK